MSCERLVLSAEEIAAAGFRFGHPLEEACQVTTPLPMGTE